MPAPGHILREIHRLRRFIKDLEGRLDQGPKAHRSLQLKVSQAEETLRQAQESLKQFKVKIHEKEGSIKASQQNIEKLEKTPVTNKKEYDALRAEIATIKSSITKLEDEILDLMGTSDDKSRQIPDLEKGVQKAKSDAAQFDKDYQEKLKLWAGERDNAVKQLAEVEATLPDDVAPQYKRLSSARGQDAMSRVENRICVTCYTEVTAQMWNELQRGLFVVCKNCGRMLYVGEE